MSEEMEGQLSYIMLVDYVHGFVVECRFCQQVLCQGRYAISMQTKAGNYLIANHTRIGCCKKEEILPLIFSEEEEAEDVMDSLIALLKENTRPPGFCLVEFPGFARPTIH